MPSLAVFVLVVLPWLNPYTAGQTLAVWPLLFSWTCAAARPSQGLRYLPLLTRKQSWTVLIDAQTTAPVGFLPLDSF